MGKMYGTINVKEVRSRGIGGCEEHNRRQYQPSQMPKNVDTSRSHLNEEWIAGGKANFTEAIDEKLEGLTVRKNAVKALEYVLGASPEFFKLNPDSAKGYLMCCEEFVNQKHKKENVVAVNRHFDEKTPHIHMLVVPIVEKEVRWKNKKREGAKRERRLCARDFTGHPDMLRELQQDFYNYISDFGRFIGTEFTKYTSLQEQSRTYNERVDHRIDAILQYAQQAQQELPGLKQQLEQTQYMLAHYEHELEKKIALKKQQEAALKRQIELNEQKVRDKEELEKKLKEKLEYDKRVEKLKKINNAKGKGKDKGGPRFGMGGM